MMNLKDATVKGLINELEDQMDSLEANYVSVSWTRKDGMMITISVTETGETEEDAEDDN